MTAVRITWWGHATVALSIGGLTLLTDPVLTSRLAHLRRIGSPVPPRSVTSADAVLVSHLHADHLHLPSLRAFRGSVELVVPRGAGALCAGGRWRGGAVHEVSVDDVVTFGPADGSVQVRAVHAEHDGRRLPGSRYRGAALGYVVSAGTTRVWFAGDTGLFAGMPEIGPVDIAVVPVGGWGPTLGPHHLDPEQAAEAVSRVRVRHAVPIHYGTLWPIGLRRLAPTVFAERFVAPGQRFAAAVAERGSDVSVHVLAPGGSVDVDG